MPPGSGATKRRALRSSKDVLEQVRALHLGRCTGVLRFKLPNASLQLHFIVGELYLRKKPLSEQLTAFLGEKEAYREDRARVEYPRSEESRHLIEMVAVHISEWQPLASSFEDVPGLSPSGLVGPLPTVEILRSASVAKADEAELLARLGGAGAYLQRSTMPTAGRRQLLDAEEAAVLEALKVPSTLEEVLREVGGDRQISLQTMVRLWSEGQIRRMSESSISAHKVGLDLGPSAVESAAAQIDRDLWQAHFGFSGDPFSLAPDPRMLFLSKNHQEALAGLHVALLEGRGLVVMIGEVGTGKTTLVYSLLSSLDARFETAYLSNPSLTFDEILESALSDFGVTPAGNRRLDLLNALNGFLRRCEEDGKSVALVIDEAHRLSDECLEQLRLLINFETFTKKLLQIVLIAQPELGDRLNSVNLRQIADRIAIRCCLNPLGKDDSRAYIRHRLDAVGGSPATFTRRALGLIVKKADGIPRRVNVLCHNSLVIAYGRDGAIVSRSIVQEVVREVEGRTLIRRPGGGPRLASFADVSLKAAVGLIALVALAGALYLTVESARDRSSRLGIRRPATQAEPSARDRLSRPVSDSIPGLPVEESQRAPESDEEKRVEEDYWSFDGMGLVTANLNLRSAPDLQSPILETIPRFGALELLEDGADWYRVRYGRRTGWVNTQYIAILRSHVDRSSEASPVDSEEKGPWWLEVTSGQTLCTMLVRLYGSCEGETLARVKAANPELADPDHLLPGDLVRVPGLSLPPLADDRKNEAGG